MSQINTEEDEAIKRFAQAVIEQVKDLSCHVFISKEYTFSSKCKDPEDVTYRCSVVDNLVLQVRAQLFDASLDALQTRIMEELKNVTH